MPAIVEFPEVVESFVQYFSDLFANEPQRRHLAEYLTGLMLAERKTVSGIQREFANAADQSCLNRFLTSVDWNVEQFNDRRLQWLQQSPDTRYSERGVIAIDNVLIDHDGKLIEDIGYFWDHAEQRHKIAHDYLIVNYVCESNKHYPLEQRRFQKREQCERQQQPFVNHTQLFCELIDDCCDRGIPGDFTMDSYFTNTETMNHIQSKRDAKGQPRAYVGDLKLNRKVEYRGRQMGVTELAATIPLELRKELRRGDERQWTFTIALHLPQVNHKVRLVLIWNHRRDAQPVKVLVTNRVIWEVTRICGTYRKRWTGTETFHRDGKQQLGMGDCQFRNGQGQTRHMYLVMAAYSLLVGQLRTAKAKCWAYKRLTTIGQACRAMIDEMLRKTIAWAIEKSHEKSSNTPQILAELALI